MVSFSSTFMATAVPVSESTTNLTLAKLPCPMVWPTSYRPTCFFCPPTAAIPRFSDSRLLPIQHKSLLKKDAGKKIGAKETHLPSKLAAAVLGLVRNRDLI
jgi:hypothetical protein